MFPDVHKTWSPHPKVTSTGLAQRRKAQPCGVGFSVSDVMLPSPGRASLVPERRHAGSSLARPGSSHFGARFPFSSEQGFCAAKGGRI